jgi:hypothetical protein
MPWLDYHNIPDKEVDVLDFIEEDSVATPQAKKPSRRRVGRRWHRSIQHIKRMAATQRWRS